MEKKVKLDESDLEKRIAANIKAADKAVKSKKRMKGK